MFGTQANRRILVRFLNALFSDEFTVTKVEFHDKEILPKSEGWADGRAEGRAEGEAQGLAKGIIIVVRNMLNFGMPKDQVTAINNMTIAELNNLLDQK